MSDDQPGVRIDARVLPFPRSISPEAQAVLRRLVGDDGVPLNTLHAMPAADDHRAWLAVKAIVDRHYTSVADTLGATLHSQAKTIEFEETTVHLATPAEAINSDAAIIDIHGGAFVFGGGEACRVSARSQAESHGISCYGVDYRVPPDHPYPAALDDCMATYRYVLEHHEASRIAIIGRSAGGNLAAAMLLRARAEA